jgi:hypothetical protein
MYRSCTEFLSLSNLPAIEILPIDPNSIVTFLVPTSHRLPGSFGKPGAKAIYSTKNGPFLVSAEVLASSVVASAVNEEGEPIHPRKWNHEFIDMPVIDKKKQKTPSFTGEFEPWSAPWLHDCVTCWAQSVHAIVASSTYFMHVDIANLQQSISVQKRGFSLQSRGSWPSHVLFPRTFQRPRQRERPTTSGGKKEANAKRSRGNRTTAPRFRVLAALLRLFSGAFFVLPAYGTRAAQGRHRAPRGTCWIRGCAYASHQ